MRDITVFEDSSIMRFQKYLRRLSEGMGTSDAQSIKIDIVGDDYFERRKKSLDRIHDDAPIRPTTSKVHLPRIDKYFSWRRFLHEIFSQILICSREHDGLDLIMISEEWSRTPCSQQG